MLTIIFTKFLHQEKKKKALLKEKRKNFLGVFCLFSINKNKCYVCIWYFIPPFPTMFSSLSEANTMVLAKFYNFVICKYLDSFPHDIFLDWFKFKAFADNKIIVTEKLKSVLGMVENIVGKGENAVYQHFLLFPQ